MKMKLKTFVIGALGILLVSCAGGVNSNSPEGATEAYVSAIAKAEYDKALELSTGSAEETVNQMKADGTEGYETRIVEVKCEVDEASETAQCKCTERRADTTIFLDYKYDSFVYDLEKMDDVWKISSQTKDMAMPDFGDMGLGDEDMMQDMPVEEADMDAADSHEGHNHDEEGHEGHDH